MLERNEPTVLHIIDTISTGGAQTVLIDFLLYEAHHSTQQVFVLRTTKNRLSSGTIPVEVYPSPSRWSLMCLLRLYRLVDQFRPSIIHTYLFRAHVFGFIIKLVKGNKVSFILHEHGDVFEAGLIKRLVYALIGRIADSIIAVSNEAKRQLNLCYLPSAAPISVIHNFAPMPSNSVPPSAASLNMPSLHQNSNFKIGFFGRLEPEKGVDVLLDSLELIRTPLSVYIVGDGSLKLSLKNRAKRLIALHDIQFLGWRIDVSQLMSQMQAVVVPSRRESFGRVALEAQAEGIPVIAADICGLDEFLRDEQNAILFKSEDPLALAKQIVRLASDNDLAARLTVGGRATAERLSISEYSKQLNTLYNGLTVTRALSA